MPAPPHVKAWVVRDHAQRFDVDAFVETGTYRGDTLAAVRRYVPESYSIELDARLAEMARRRFHRRPDVHIIEGDSTVHLPRIVHRLSGPALFWLDGHFSGGGTAHGEKVTPIEAEIASVLGPNQPDHVVLVDDARLFSGAADYPRLEDLRSLVRQLRPDWHFEVEIDIVRVHAPRAALRS